MNKKELILWIEHNKKDFVDMARAIWEKPEVALEEVFASQTQKEYFKRNGFIIKEIPGIPTAFIAEYGNAAHPILGFLGEYDALANLSQKNVAHCEPVIQGGNGHGCGHNLIGAGGMASVAAIKKILEKGEAQGTVRYYGCPAEENVQLSGKVTMLKAGMFDDADVLMSWHPESVNKVIRETFEAETTVKIKYRSQATENATWGSPDQALQILHFAANLLGNEISASHRIEYGDSAAQNDMCEKPMETEVVYKAFGPNINEANRLMEELVKIAEYAAAMTNCTCECGPWKEYLNEKYNCTLGDLIYDNMKQAGTAGFTEENYEFAEQIFHTMNSEYTKRVIDFYNIPENDRRTFLHEGAVKSEKNDFKPTSDVGNVSYKVPTGMFFSAVVPIGQPLHTWQAAACCGNDLGFKGMIFASKIIAGVFYDLLMDSTLLNRVKEDHQK